MTCKKRSARTGVRRASLPLLSVILMLVGGISWAMAAIGVLKQAGNPLLNPLFVAGAVMVGTGMLFGAVNVLRSIPASVLRKYLPLEVGLILVWVVGIIWGLAGVGVLRVSENVFFDPFFTTGIVLMCIGALLWVCLYFYHEFYKITD